MSLPRFHQGFGRLIKKDHTLEILEAINRYTLIHNEPPQRQDILREVGITTKRFDKYLNEMRKSGLLRKPISRGMIRLTPTPLALTEEGLKRLKERE